jgi:hypothetical protein
MSHGARISFIHINASEQYDHFFNEYKRIHRFSFDNYHHDNSLKLSSIDLLVTKGTEEIEKFSGTGVDKKEAIRNAKENFLQKTSLSIPLKLMTKYESNFLARFFSFKYYIFP